jgi:hypothetical protein
MAVLGKSWGSSNRRARPCQYKVMPEPATSSHRWANSTAHVKRATEVHHASGQPLRTSPKPASYRQSPVCSLKASISKRGYIQFSANQVSISRQTSSSDDLTWASSTPPTTPSMRPTLRLTPTYPSPHVPPRHSGAFRLAPITHKTKVSDVADLCSAVLHPIGFLAPPPIPHLQRPDNGDPPSPLPQPFPPADLRAGRKRRALS